MTSLIWLHLSDLHACNVRAGWDAKRILDKLRKDLQHMQKEYGLHPDFIFFTGDAAFGEIGDGPGEKIAEQFREAHDFFEGIRSAFNPAVERANVFLVPGNHDVDRSQVTPPLTEWLDGKRSLAEIIQVIKSDGLTWKHYIERLAAYRAFLQDCGYSHLLDDSDRLIYAVRREVRGCHIGIAGFNSSWSCGRDHERGKLWVGGRWQIGHLVPKLEDVDVSIALIHHPGGWFVEQEEPQFSRELEREFKFHLHGHEHRDWIDAKADGPTRIAAAACYDGSDHENGYNFVRLNLETGKGEVFLRRYEADGGGWVPRVIYDKTDDHGVWLLKHLPLKSERASPTNPLVLNQPFRSADAGADPRSAVLRTNRHANPPVLNQPWLQAKSELYLFTDRIAAAVGGESGSAPHLSKDVTGFNDDDFRGKFVFIDPKTIKREYDPRDGEIVIFKAVFNQNDQAHKKTIWAKAQYDRDEFPFEYVPGRERELAERMLQRALEELDPERNGERDHEADRKPGATDKIEDQDGGRVKVTGTTMAFFASTEAGLHLIPLEQIPLPRINSGGGAADWYAADEHFIGGLTLSTVNAIDTSAVTNPAPQAVYQTERYDAFTYALPGLKPGANYTVRLHFAEFYWTKTGQRAFNVAINDIPVLTNYDIVAAAGSTNKAIVEELPATADSSGTITIVYTHGTTALDTNAKSSGIEIIAK